MNYKGQCALSVDPNIVPFTCPKKPNPFFIFLCYIFGFWDVLIDHHFLVSKLLLFEVDEAEMPLSRNW